MRTCVCLHTIYDAASKSYGVNRPFLMGMPLGFCKPDSVRPFERDGHFSQEPAERFLPRSEAKCNYYPGVIERAGYPPPVCLASRGACRAPVVTFGAVGSYPTISPLPLQAVYFLWRYPSSRLDPRLPRFRGARCLVMSGLSSTGLHPQRPPEPERRRPYTTVLSE